MENCAQPDCPVYTRHAKELAGACHLLFALLGLYFFVGYVDAFSGVAVDAALGLVAGLSLSKLLYPAVLSLLYLGVTVACLCTAMAVDCWRRRF